MRFLTLFLVFKFVLFAAFGFDFLSAEKAFVPHVKVNEKSQIVIEIDLAKDIYIYKNSLKIKLESDSFAVDDIIYPQSKKIHNEAVYEKSPKFILRLKKTNGDNGEVKLVLGYRGCSKQGLCYTPIVKKYTLHVDVNKFKNNNLSKSDFIASKIKNSSFLVVILTFFVSGFLLSLTPCVFPMIPIISGIIVSQGKNVTTYKAFMLSLVYVIAMAFAYTLAGVLAGLFGANLQAMFQNQYIIYAFSAIFVLLAFSMFGFYELRLPSFISQKTSTNSSNAGYVGVAIMGFLSALVVSPCVAAPLAGALVYIGQSGDAILGGFALFAMGIGMGVPLIAVGVSAGRFMPRPGGWMNTVSVTFGFVMLGVAVWMLEKVLDSVYIDILYACILFGYAWYLGVFRKNIHIAKRVISVLVLVCSIGLFSYVLNDGFSAKNSEIGFKNINSLDELDIVLKNSQGKKILLDFSAKWCTSCKELEENTFKDKRVLEKLKQYVLLRVDLSKETEQNKALSEKFGVFGPPVIVFFNKEHKLERSKKIVGYVDAEEFLKIESK